MVQGVCLTYTLFRIFKNSYYKSLKSQNSIQNKIDIVIILKANKNY